MLGSGAIIVVDDSRAGRRRRAEAREVLRHESCGKCTPCREGTNWTVKMLERDRRRARRRRWTSTSSPRSRTQIIGNCLCVLGDAMAMPIGSMVAKFRDEFEAHIEQRAQRAGLGAPRRGCGGVRSDAAPRGPHDHVHDRRPRGRRRPRARCSSTARSTATSRSPSSVTSRSSASRSARAACASSRSRASRSSRPPARRRSRTAWSSTRRPTRVKEAQNTRRRVPARQPPARLPRLRQGRRVPAAGHHLRLGPRDLAHRRAQAPLQEAARALAADRDRPRALHPLLPLRALLAGGHRGLPADPARARRALVRRHVRRASVRRAVQRQHHRAVPGRRADLARLPLPRAAVGHRGRGLGLHAVPGAVQRRAAPSATSASLRVLARDHEDVDDGWLCDKGRFAYQSIHVRRADHRAAGARRRRAAAGVVGARA